MQTTTTTTRRNGVGQENPRPGNASPHAVGAPAPAGRGGSQRAPARPQRGPARSSSDQPREKPAPEILKTIAFDSVGVKKYALQIQKARNGNPCLRIVEGTPLDDGTFRKFDLRIWSEDFERFFKAIDEMRTFIKVHEVRTPAGHVWKPRKKAGR